MCKKNDLEILTDLHIFGPLAPLITKAPKIGASEIGPKTQNGNFL
jgi:hypothetical protein